MVISINGLIFGWFWPISSLVYPLFCPMIKYFWHLISAPFCTSLSPNMKMPIPIWLNSWMLGGIITVAAGVVCGKKKKKWESIDGCGHFLSFATLFLTKLLQQVARRKTGGMGKKGKKQTAATRSFFFVPVYQRSILSF